MNMPSETIIPDAKTKQRAAALFADHQNLIYRQTDHLFAGLMIFQWLAGIVIACLVSPRAWEGTSSHLHPHVVMAIFLGGAITLFPVYLAIFGPGKAITRHTVAVGQMLMSALLIHLSGGRVDTHFHVFGSLAFIACYRDWRVLLTATLVTAADHLLRGLYAPLSLFGVMTVDIWRSVEHAGWVLFEDFFLFLSMSRAVGGMLRNAGRHAQLEATNEMVESASLRLKESEELTRLIVDNALDAVITIDIEGRITRWNRQAEIVFGWSASEVMGESLAAIIIPPEYRERHERGIKHYMATGEGPVLNQRIEVSAIHREGHAFPIEIAISTLKTSNGFVFSAFIHDITDRKEAEESLRKANAVLENAVEGISQLDAEGRYLAVNAAYADIVGCSCEEMIGLNWETIILPEDYPKIMEAYDLMLRKGKSDVEAQGVRKNGCLFYMQMTLIASCDDHGNFVGNHCFMKDISERKELEAMISHQAYHDALSGLPNRLLFTDRVTEALSRNKRHVDTHAVMFLDLDNFKIINDSLGHEEGDHLLVIVARRLQECVRPGDTVARMGGDEFTILLEDIAREDDAIHIAERIIQCLREPISLSSREIFVTCSIGIALTTQSTHETESLIRDADTAMYQAKLSGKANFILYDHSMNDRVVERLELENGLRRAVENKEFRVYYQPIMNIETAEIVGAEALVRWEHPKLGLVSPAKFIPLAEETGLIVPIGAWVLREACFQAKIWQQQHKGAEPFVMSVNLSGRQLQSPHLQEMVVNVLQETGLDARHLKLEITESVMMEDVDATIDKLNGLKSLGVLLAVDDFGTGYSSLSYLRRLPVDTVKIDRSFVNIMGEGTQPTAIVQTIIMLCRALNLDVTGEGIENPEQLCQLQSLGCDLGQGFHFSKPVDRDAFSALMTMEGSITDAIKYDEGISSDRTPNETSEGLIFETEVPALMRSFNLTVPEKKS